MNQIFVRPYRQSDFEKLISWGKANPAWDSSVLSYSGTSVLTAFNNSGVLGFLPVQKALMMEAMAFHPLTTDSQKALVMKELTHTLITLSYTQGSGEIYFVGSDANTNDFAERQGFKRMEWPAYRVRVKDLEAGGIGNVTAAND